MPPLTPVVKNLLIINVAIFALIFLGSYIGLPTAAWAQEFALYYPSSENFRPIQLVTHFFMHGGLTHIFFNMFGLYMFGPLLEVRYGPKRFLILYLLAAAGAVLLHFGYTWYQINHLQELLAGFEVSPTLANFNDFFRGIDTKSLTMDNGQRVSTLVAELQNALVLKTEDPTQTLRNSIGIMQEYIDFKASVPMVGASGAIYGIVAAFAILYPDFKLMLIFLPIPIKARYFVPVLLGVEIFLGIMEYSWDPIAHWAHLGGGALRWAAGLHLVQDRATRRCAAVGPWRAEVKT